MSADLAARGLASQAMRTPQRKPRWGNVLGTLSEQTDLQTALDDKAEAAHTHAQSDITGLAASLAGKEASIAAGTTAQYWRGDKSWQTLDKTAVGLANVDNTSDAGKPISTATQTALDAKAALAGALFTGAVYFQNSNPILDGVELLLRNPASPFDTRGRFGANAFETYLDGDVFKFRDLAGSPRLTMASGGNVGIGETAPDYKLDVNGSFGFTPGASVTPVDNGDVVFELTDNTTLTIKAKGSDGTVRTATLVLI